MRAEPLLRLTILVATLLGAALLGWYSYASYWGDVRRTVAYGAVAQAATLAGGARVKALEEALSIDPGNWLANEQLAEQELFDGKLREAERHLVLSLRRNPKSPLSNFTMAVVQYRLGAIDAALPYVQAAARLDPGNRQYEGLVSQLQAAKSAGKQPGLPLPHSGSAFPQGTTTSTSLVPGR